MVSRRDQHVTFRTICSGAEQVFLVGDFNGWSSEATPMHRIGRDLWQITLELPPGEYRFRYFTSDNRWITDFGASGLVFNEYGEWDSLVRVPKRSRRARNLSTGPAADGRTLSGTRSHA